MFRELMDGSIGATRLLGLMLVLAVAGCTGSQVTAPEAVAPNLVKSANLVVDPLDSLTVTHTFDELTPRCVFGDSLPNPYEGLSFESTPYYSACPSPNGTVAIVPANPKSVALAEIVIDLPRPAVSASVDIYDIDPSSDVTLNAYDGSGNLMASATNTTKGAWVTLTVTGAMERLGIASGQGNTFLDNLSITSAPTKPQNPTDKGQCKKGGWRGFGFRNQGQCVRFLETSKDSR